MLRIGLLESQIYFFFKRERVGIFPGIGSHVNENFKHYCSILKCSLLHF